MFGHGSGDAEMGCWGRIGEGPRESGIESAWKNLFSDLGLPTDDSGGEGPSEEPRELSSCCPFT
jgi:hypothetical protein